MLILESSPHFLSFIKKIKNKAEQDRIKKQINKIIANPETEKPMKYTRKGTREVYIGSFRISYAYFQKENKLIFLDIYHKDEK